MPHLRILIFFLLNLILTVVFAGASLADVVFSNADPTPHIGVTEQGTGSGRVTGPDINCTSGSVMFCDGYYPVGTTATITATAAPGSVFTGWSGACSGVLGNQCTLVVNQYLAVTATFDSIGPPPQLVAGVESGSGVSINSLGEVVWSQYDLATNQFQIFSSQRGMITSDTPAHHYPALNSLGDLVWIETDWDSSQPFSVRGIIAGSPVTITSSDSMISKVDINDLREVVWSKDDGNVSHIYSTARGQLTSDERLSSFNPSINNNGDVVFLLSDREAAGVEQVYKLSAGSTIPVALTADALNHFDVSINDAGEVVWSEYDQDAFESRAVSDRRGVLWTYMQIVGVDINNCGDLVYAPYTSDGGVVYRLGSNSPCANTTGTGDTVEEPVTKGDVFTVLAKSHAAPIALTASTRRPATPSKSQSAKRAIVPPCSRRSPSAPGDTKGQLVCVQATRPGVKAQP